MVYKLIYLVYIAEGSGVPIWKFLHHRTPSEIVENITGKDDSIIVGYLSALSHFSKATLGTYVHSMNLGKYVMFYWFFKIGDNDIITLVIADAGDKRKAVKQTITEFFEKYGKVLEDYIKLAEESLSDPDKARQAEILSKKLESGLQEILDGKIRAIKFIANRDLKTVLLGSISTYLFFALMFLTTLYLNSLFNWYTRGELGILLAVIITLDLLLPSILLGLVIGYRDGALLGGFFTGIAIIGTLTITYANDIVSWASQWKIGLFIYPFWVVLIFIIGGAMGLIASYIAEKIVEERTLIPPKEISTIEGEVSEEEELTLESRVGMEEEENG